MLNNEGFFNIFTIGKEIKRQKYIFCSIFLTCVMGAYLFSELSTPKYEAQITLLPVPQEGENSISTGLGAVSSLLGNNSPGSAERPSWLEATIILQTHDFAKKFILSQNIMQTLIDEHNIDTVWNDLSDGQKQIQLNVIARHWISKNIKIEQDPLTNVYYFTVISSDPDQAVDWATNYIRDINAHLKAYLVEENEHKISFYRDLIAQEKVGDIKASIVNLLSAAIQKRALVDTRKEIVLRTIDHVEIAILSFPLLKLNLAIGIFIGLILASITILLIGSYQQYLRSVSEK